MNLFKRRRAGVESRDWYLRFSDGMGVQRGLRLFADRRASEQAGANVERLRDFKQAGRALDNGLIAFVEGLSGEVRGKLAAWGLLDREQAASGKPLLEEKERENS